MTSLHCRISCTVASTHPGDAVELPSQPLPLQEADTEEEHQVVVEEQLKQVCHMHILAACTALETQSEIGFPVHYGW